MLFKDRQISMVNDILPGIVTISQSHNFVACLLYSQPRIITWDLNLSLAGALSFSSAHRTVSEERKMTLFGPKTLLHGAEVKSNLSS